MSDTEYLKWIAEHLLYFRPVFNFATMTYLNDSGDAKEITFNHPEAEKTELEQLKNCIDLAINEPL